MDGQAGKRLSKSRGGAGEGGAELVQSAESATAVTSPGPSQSEMEPEQATTNTTTEKTEFCCTYPNERRERNLINTLLNISNGVNEHEEKSWECANNATGWEDAVQDWTKTPPFAHLQLQKRAKRTRTSESVGGCLYCLDTVQIPDKSLEQDPKTGNQLKSDVKLSSCAATESIPEKQETQPNSSTTVNSSSAVEDTKKESSLGKVYSTHSFQGEKKKMTLKEAQAALSERKFYLMKEANQLLHPEKRAVPIKEYNIMPPSKPRSLETLKCKCKGHESSVCNLINSEMNPRSLPPLKESTLKSNQDSSPKKSKTVIPPARQKTVRAVSETVSRTKLFKSDQHKRDKEIDRMSNAMKEQIKIRELAACAPKAEQIKIREIVPKPSKTSSVSRNPDQCYCRGALLPNRKLANMPNWIAVRRNNQLNGMPCLHTKGEEGTKAHEIREACAKNRRHIGTKLGNEPKTQETPLLSGLFPSLTELSWGRATPFACYKIPPKPKKRRISKMVSNFSHENVMSMPKKDIAWITHLVQDQTRSDWPFKETEMVSSNKKIQVCCIKPYNYIPMMAASAEDKRVRGRLDSIQTYLGEKRTLPIKEYEIKSLQRCPEPHILQCKKTDLPNVTHSDPPTSLSCVTLNALLVFRPDKEGVLSVQLEPPLRKTEATVVKRAEKGSSTSTKNVSYIHGTKKIKPKRGKKIGMMNTTKKQIKKSCNTR